MLTVTAVEAGETQEIVISFNDDEGKSLVAGEVEDGKGNQIDLDVNVIDENGIKTKLRLQSIFK